MDVQLRLKKSQKIAPEKQYFRWFRAESWAKMCNINDNIIYLFSQYGHTHKPLDGPQKWTFWSPILNLHGILLGAQHHDFSNVISQLQACLQFMEALQSQLISLEDAYSFFFSATQIAQSQSILSQKSSPPQYFQQLENSPLFYLNINLTGSFPSSLTSLSAPVNILLP